MGFSVDSYVLVGGIAYQLTVYHPSEVSVFSPTQFGAVLASPVDKSESSAAILRDELRQSQQSLASWQDSWRQAKGACEAWKKEAEDVAARARMERESSRRRIDEVRRDFCLAEDVKHDKQNRHKQNSTQNTTFFKHLCTNSQ